MKKHLAFSGRSKKDEEKIIYMSKKNKLYLIKNNIIIYLINNSELDLKSLQVCEGGVFMKNKELRFKPLGDLWDFDYKCIPLYNRIPEDLFSKQELENIRDLFIKYFNDTYNIKLKCKFVSMDDLTKMMFK